jgi:sugar-specific transcriptional regulator TrmB
MIKSNTKLIDRQLLNALLTLNLTRKEAHAYYTLVLNGVMTAEDISKKINVQYPIVYRTLGGLKNKGWIDSTSDRPKKYRALPPKTAATSSGNQQISTINESIGLITDLLETLYNEKQEMSLQEIWSVQSLDNVIRKICDISERTSNMIEGVVTGPIDDMTFNLLFGNIPAHISIIVQIIGPPIVDIDDKLKKHIKIKQPKFEMNKKTFPMGDFNAKTKEKFLQNVHGNRFISVHLLFDEKEALWINLPYKDNILIRENVWANWIIDPEYVKLIKS